MLVVLGMVLGFFLWKCGLWKMWKCLLWLRLCRFLDSCLVNFGIEMVVL